jgi:CrcB protein
MKDLFFVCVGSFFGGGARYLVGKAVQSWVTVSSFPGTARPFPSKLAFPVAFPWGTMAVNVIGCFLIGLLSGLSLGGQISPTTKLVLVTGFCGGFTTFSTFMNENLLLGRDGAMLSAVLYTLLSLALGLIAVIVGYQIVK